MSTDLSGSQFTITEIRIDDPRLNEYDELPEEEKQSSFVAIIQLLPGSDRLEIEEMDGQLAWGHSKLSIEDFASIEALGLRGWESNTSFFGNSLPGGLQPGRMGLPEGWRGRI